MFFQNQQHPMSPEQISRLRSQIDAKQLGMSYGNYAPNIGGGFHALADGIALRTMRNRLGSQFPNAPGGGSQQPPSNQLRQKIVEGITGNRAPWQFPAAPPASQQPTASRAPEMAGGGAAGGSSGGLSGMFRGLMNLKSGGGLW